LALFRRHGYRQFEEVLDYYEDHMDALRFEKSLAPHLHPELLKVPYYEQTLDFTCGPACLMMAMKALSPALELHRKLELRIWREATTIFMTSGHGGCSPYGLALAAYYRGFDLEVYVNESGVFLVDSVRSQEKKEVVRLVQEDMIEEIEQLPIALHYGSLGVDALQQKFEGGGIPVVLISSYRIYGERFPHWVVVTGFDAQYIYAHDPFVDYAQGETVTDSINMPISRREFQRMARYGRAGQKAIVILYPTTADSWSIA
jgi:Peptidase_C39 like family